jgi:P pilus assembly chaperone PapD
MIKSSKLLQLFCVFLASAFAGAFASQAMSIEPLLLEVSSFGKGTTQSFQVTNNGASSLPVEVNVSKVEIGPDGELRYEVAENDFLIYPPQANIPKGAAQIFRVQWIGDPDIDESRNYRLAVSQVPITLPEGTSGIQITMSFGVIVSVSPPQGNAAIAVTGAKPAKGEDGKQAVALNVKNTGNKHAYMRDAAISLSGGGWSQTLTALEVGQKIGLGIVQPGKERRFLIPLEVPPGVSDITASIDYQPGK